VFVDECGVATNLVRLYGRAPRGARAVGRAPYGRWERLRIFGGLSLALGLGACMSVEGAADTLATVAFVEHVLAPRARARAESTCSRRRCTPGKWSSSTT
jgi:hypothetical protein